MSYLGKVRHTVALTSSDIVDGAITTDKIVDDAVTDVKVANAINTSIAANTAKVTNATHTGDVTGATALTIATDAVDIAMLSATGTASSSTFLRGDNAWAAAGGGKVVQMVQMDYSGVEENTTSGTYQDSSLTAAITPASGSNIVVAVCSVHIGYSRSSSDDTGINCRIYNSTDGVEIMAGRAKLSGAPTSNWDIGSHLCLIGCDTGRTVATTYLLQFSRRSSGTQARIAEEAFNTFMLLEVEP